MLAPILSVEAAERLTSQIIKATEDIGTLLFEAQEGQAWRVLGYKSWGAYIEGRFAFKRSRSYQLLTQAKVNRRLVAAGETTRVTEREARDLSTVVDTSTIRQKVEIRRQPVPPLKQKKPKRGIPTVEREAQAISEAIDRFEAWTGEGGDDELVAYLSGEQRRLVERAVTKAGEFAERWGDLLSRPVRLQRDVEESA